MKRFGSMRVVTAPPSSNRGIWKSLLEGAARSAEYEDSTILILGDRDAGKASLIRSLQKVGGGTRKLTEMELHKESVSVAGVDFAYINVRNTEDTDVSEFLAKANVWILESAQHAPILKQNLDSQKLRHMLIMISLNLAEPWTILSRLREWLEFAADFVQDLMKDLPFEEQGELRRQNAAYTEAYRRKVEEGTSLPAKGSSENLDCLRVNLGVPVIISINKSDATASLDTRNCPGRSDVVLAHIRHVALPYGAAVIYNCTKDRLSSRNVDLMYSYLMHRLYGFDFSEPINLLAPDSVFIPSGWDTQEEIQKFAETTVAEGLEIPLEALLPPPLSDEVTLTTTEANKLQIRDMNQFLASVLSREPGLLQSALSQSSGSPQSASAAHFSSANPSAAINLTSSSASAVQQSQQQQQQIAPTTSSSKSARGGDDRSSRDIKEGRRTSSTIHRAAAAASNPDAASSETARGGGATTRRLVAGEPGTARGDPASLRQFFQTLLNKGAKEPKGGTPTTSTATPAATATAAVPTSTKVHTSHSPSTQTVEEGAHSNEVAKRTLSEKSGRVSVSEKQGSKVPTASSPEKQPSPEAPRAHRSSRRPSTGVTTRTAESLTPSPTPNVVSRVSKQHLESGASERTSTAATATTAHSSRTPSPREESTPPEKTTRVLSPEQIERRLRRREEKEKLRAAERAALGGAESQRAGP